MEAGSKKTEEGRIRRAACEAPLTKEIWANWRYKTMARTKKGDIPIPEGGPKINREGFSSDYRWPVSFLPDNVAMCPLYEMRMDLMAVNMYRNKQLDI